MASSHWKLQEPRVLPWRLQREHGPDDSLSFGLLASRTVSINLCTQLGYFVRVAVGSYYLGPPHSPPTPSPSCGPCLASLPPSRCGHQALSAALQCLFSSVPMWPLPTPLSVAFILYFRRR